MLSTWKQLFLAYKSNCYKGLSVYNATAGLKRQFFRFVTKIIKAEVSKLLNVNTAFELCQKVDIPSIGKFSWESTFTMLEENAPLLLTTLKR